MESVQTKSCCGIDAWYEKQAWATQDSLKERLKIRECTGNGGQGIRCTPSFSPKLDHVTQNSFLDSAITFFPTPLLDFCSHGTGISLLDSYNNMTQKVPARLLQSGTRISLLDSYNNMTQKVPARLLQSWDWDILA